MNAATPLRVVTFGDLEGTVWGAAFDAGEPVIAFGTPYGSRAGAVRLTPESSGWRLAGDGVELLITPAGGDSDPKAPDEADEHAGASIAELCQAAGTLTVAGSERSVQCLGTRSLGDGREPRELDSVRGLSGWFGADRGLALLARRPAGRGDQEADLIAATLFEPDGPVAVADPRLSTTFGAAERPLRASLELWIAEGEQEFPRRAAAQARGEGAVLRSGGAELRVTPLRCQSGGLDGAGVYLLARL